MPILIVDDDRAALQLLDTLVGGAARVPTRCFSDPLAALRWCGRNTPELVLLDYRMPALSGVEFIRRFRRQARLTDVPIVMVTSVDEAGVRERARAAGATDFVAKPVEVNEFRLRVRNLLALNEARTALAERALRLQYAVAQAASGIAERELELVMRLARAAEFRDPETGAHLQRMALYAGLIARQLGCTPAFEQQLTEAAPMHDIGKLATPDAILLKRGRLSEDEMVVMREHAMHGAHILSGSTAPLMQLAEQIARCHHERFDGGGYPQGLQGLDIPLAARIVAVADVFDALSSHRPYKHAWPLDEARAYIAAHSGSHFCPTVVQAFLQCWDEVVGIHQKLPDPPPLRH